MLFWVKETGNTSFPLRSTVVWWRIDTISFTTISLMSSLSGYVNVVLCKLSETFLTNFIVGFPTSLNDVIWPTKYFDVFLPRKFTKTQSPNVRSSAFLPHSVTSSKSLISCSRAWGRYSSSLELEGGVQASHSPSSYHMVNQSALQYFETFARWVSSTPTIYNLLNS